METKSKTRINKTIPRSRANLIYAVRSSAYRHFSWVYGQAYRLMEKYGISVYDFIDGRKSCRRMEVLFEQIHADGQGWGINKPENWKGD